LRIVVNSVGSPLLYSFQKKDVVNFEEGIHTRDK